jgi:NitT/TauT family transport system substrate-binding protein
MTGRYHIRALMTALCISAAVNYPASSADLVKVGVANTASDVSFFIADKKGYFRDEGIEVDLIPFASATQMVAPLGTGELDVGAGAPGAGLYNAAARDIAVKIVADKGSMPPGHGYLSLVVRKDLITTGKVTSPADLKGLKIGDLSRQGSGDVTLNEILKKGNLKFGDVDAVYMGAPQLAAALQNGALDAALITEPSLSIAVASGSAVLLIKGDEAYPNQQLAVTLFSEKMVQNKRDLAQRFMNAYVKAARFYNDALEKGKLAGPNAKDVIDILVERTNLKDPKQYSSMVPNGLNPDGCANAAGLRHDFEFYKQMGWVDPKLDPDGLVDDSFCKTAVAKLGPYVRAR